VKSGVAWLALFVLLRGSDSSLLKALQQAGNLTHAQGGPEAISFCNVFFFSSLICGLGVVLIDRQGLRSDCSQLRGSDRWLLAGQGFSGFFLGPVAFFLALNRLSVVEQTLLFSLTVPVTAWAAHHWLKEPLPRSFPISCALITVGLLLSSHTGSPAGTGIDGHGVVWALVGVVAFAASGVLARVNSQRGWGVGLTVGLNSLVASGVFAVIALILFGPSHFFYLRLWWVVGVIAGYGAWVTLGSQWSLMEAYQALGVVPVTLWSSLTIVVSLAEAHVALHEPITASVIVGSSLILAAIVVYQRSSRGDAQATPQT